MPTHAIGISIVDSYFMLIYLATTHYSHQKYDFYHEKIDMEKPSTERDCVCKQSSRPTNR